MNSEITAWLLAQGPGYGAAAALLWFLVRMEARHERELENLRTQLAAERTRNNDLQESRLAETRSMVEVAHSVRTTMQALLSTGGK